MTKRILIVDDDEAVRESLGFVLNSAGYRCRMVAAGKQALELLESGEGVDLVTSDITNAPLSGIDFLQQVKKQFPDVPVLMVTAHYDPSTLLTCIRSGACGYLLKPCERKGLLAAVRRAAESHDGDAGIGAIHV